MFVLDFTFAGKYKTELFYLNKLALQIFFLVILIKIQKKNSKTIFVNKWAKYKPIFVLNIR